MTAISPIYRRGPTPDPTGQLADRRKREAMATAWHEHGVAVLPVEEIADEWTRQAITNEATRLYGPRKGTKHG